MRLTRRFRSGFTLVELTIVIALLSVIFTGIFTAFSTALNISRRASPTNGTNRQSIFFALENLRSTFSQTFFIDGHKRLVFIGINEGTKNARRDKVVFAAYHQNAEEVGLPAIREVSFFLRPMEDKEELFYLIRREDEMVDKNPFSGGLEHVLLDHVVSFQLKYSQRGDKWEDDWNHRDKKKIPKLIRIEIIALVGNVEMKYESLSFPGLYYK
ncbi:MAG: type II secretion system protein [Leptospiraceae bacterium]|nr:type II secretion system protein [Leptospiraceae bacterium]MCP5511381.1 type II secretion system protein [Leptospiraceae bacterium]